MARREATDIFARERDDALEALLGNLNQTVMGEPAPLEQQATRIVALVIPLPGEAGCGRPKAGWKRLGSAAP